MNINPNSCCTFVIKSRHSKIKFWHVESQRILKDWYLHQGMSRFKYYNSYQYYSTCQYGIFTLLHWVRYAEARCRWRERPERLVQFYYSEFPGENTAHAPTAQGELGAGQEVQREGLWQAPLVQLLWKEGAREGKRVKDWLHRIPLSVECKNCTWAPGTGPRLIRRGVRWPRA